MTVEVISNTVALVGLGATALIGNLLLADAAPSSLPFSWDGLLNTGLAVGYAWYTATRTIPKLIENNRQDAEKFLAALDKQQAAHAAEQAETRRLHREDIEAHRGMHNAFNSLIHQQALRRAAAPKESAPRIGGTSGDPAH